jgi:hypothetical protein
MNETKEKEMNYPWGDIPLADVKAACCEKATDGEFKAFVAKAVALQANPFAGEIYFQLQEAKGEYPRKVSVFCGISYFGRIAGEDPSYRGIECQTVHGKDIFKFVNGKINHEFGVERGALIGAYAIAHRESMTDTVVFNQLSDFNTSGSLWKTQQVTMIKARVKARAWREAFPGKLSGVYAKEEIDDFPTEKAEAEKENPAFNPPPPEVQPAASKEQLFADLTSHFKGEVGALVFVNSCLPPGKPKFAVLPQRLQASAYATIAAKFDAFKKENEVLPEQESWSAGDDIEPEADVVTYE